MSLYDDIRSSNKKKNASATKSLIRNQKLLNLAFLITFAVVILVDILYVSKENIVGVLGFTRGFMILSIILEIIFFALLVITKFNNETLLFKIATISVFSLPIIAYLPMLAISAFGIVSFILRLLFIGLLIVELVYSRRFIDKKAYLIKYATILGVTFLIFIITIAFVANKQNRRINYSYDDELDGYVVETIYEGSADVKFKNNVVKFDDNSLKNYDSKTLELPSSVKEVSKDAFKGSKIKDVYIKSSEISIYNALMNSDVENVYIENNNTKILDLDDASYESKVRFIVSKDMIDEYRDNNEKGYLFVPQTKENECYVVLNNT
nr:leucine-rich repeat protein [Acholeplasmatales bacterium]